MPDGETIESISSIHSNRGMVFISRNIQISILISTGRERLNPIPNNLTKPTKGRSNKNNLLKKGNYGIIELVNQPKSKERSMLKF